MGAGVYQASTLRRFSNQCTQRRAQRTIRGLLDQNSARLRTEALTTTALTTNAARSDIEVENFRNWLGVVVPLNGRVSRRNCSRGPRSDSTHSGQIKVVGEYAYRYQFRCGKLSRTQWFGCWREAESFSRAFLTMLAMRRPKDMTVSDRLVHDDFTTCGGLLGMRATTTPRRVNELIRCFGLNIYVCLALMK